MEKDTFIRKLLRFLGLFGLLICAVMVQNENTKAASRAVPTVRPYNNITSNQIGEVYSREENAPSVSGIRITRDGKLLIYAFDVWSYTKEKGWTFQYENLHGKTQDNRNALKLTSGYIAEILDGNDWRGRYLIYGKNAHFHVKQDPCFSIETKRYQKGQLLSTEYEYSTDPRSEWVDSKYSLMNAIYNNSSYIVGMGTPEQVSHRYVIKSGIFIGPEEDVSVEAKGAEVIGKGEAYYDSDGKYIVRKLPQAVKKRDKNVYYFDGWYTSEEGGNKVSEGDIVSKEMTLYPHWKAVSQKCNVTCVDVLQTAQGEEKLGSGTWQAEYGENVSGAAAGCASGAGIYYPGREYIGCSETVVTESDNVVYRYFKNALIDVMCIDMVQVGPDTGQQLGNHIWKSEYSSTTSGSVIGCDREVGAYYEGYRYMYCSMKQVGENGCTVYRYFTPIMYNIEFVANCDSAGNMSALRNLYYGHDYTLTINSFINRKLITLNPNGQNAVCDTSNQMVYSDFLGWSRVASGGGVMYSNGCTVNGITNKEETVRLYAVWSDKEVTLTAQPIRPGYEFAGWSKDPMAENGQKQFKAADNMNLFAVWKAVQTIYHVEYYKERTDHGYEMASRYEFLGITDTEVSAGDVKDNFPGFILDEASSHLTGIVNADGSLILSVYFRRGQYKVSFDANGGRLISDEKDMEPVTGMFEEIITLPQTKLQRTGYDFGGWTTKPDGDGVTVKPGEEYRMPNHDQILYAHWIPKNDTLYKLVPFYENINGIGYTRGEAVELRGTTSLTVKEDLVRQYGTEKSEDIIRKIFGEGYLLLEDEIFTSTVISAYGNTYVEIYLQRDAFDFMFMIKSAGETKIIAKENVLYGQDYVMPYEIEEIKEITGYCDETGKSYKPGNHMAVTGSHKFIVYQKNIHSETPVSSAAVTDSPIIESTVNPPADTDNPEAPSVGETAKPTETDDPEVPSVSKTPIPSVEPTHAPIVSKTPTPSVEPTHAPIVSKAPAPASAIPKETEQPSEISKDGMSVISTWTGADKNEIASRLAANAREAFLRKGQKVKKKGLIYCVTQTGVKNRTLCVEGVSKEKKTIRIPAQIKLRGYSYKVTQIKKGAFANKKKLQKVIVGKNIKQIGKKAFRNSRKLHQITFQSSNMLNIQSGAWKGCSRGLKLKFSRSCGQLTRRYILKKNAAMR